MYTCTHIYMCVIHTSTTVVYTHIYVCTCIHFDTCMTTTVVDICMTYICVHVDNRYAAVFFPNSEKTAAYESCKSWASRFYSVNRVECYGVATISRLLKIIGVFCKTALHKRLYSTKETYNFKEPTSRSHPIVGFK